MGRSKNSSKRDVCNNTSRPQETRKTSNEQPNVTPTQTTFPFQEPGSALPLPWLCPRSRSATSLPPRTESFPGSPGLAEVTRNILLRTPSQEMEDRHLMERRAGQSMPGCVRAALPQQAFTPRREVSEGADACHLQHVRRRVRHFPHNVSFPNPHHTTDLRPLTLLRNENIRSHPTHSHSGKIGDSNTGSSSSGVHGLSTAPYHLPVLGAKRLGSPF